MKKTFSSERVTATCETFLIASVLTMSWVCEVLFAYGNLSYHQIHLQTSSRFCRLSWYLPGLRMLLFSLHVMLHSAQLGISATDFCCHWRVFLVVITSVVDADSQKLHCTVFSRARRHWAMCKTRENQNHLILSRGSRAVWIFLYWENHVTCATVTAFSHSCACHVALDTCLRLKVQR